jgi:hypothetical protein
VGIIHVADSRTHTVTGSPRLNVNSAELATGWSTRHTCQAGPLVRQIVAVRWAEAGAIAIAASTTEYPLTPGHCNSIQPALSGTLRIGAAPAMPARSAAAIGTSAFDAGEGDGDGLDVGLDAGEGDGDGLGPAFADGGEPVMFSNGTKVTNPTTRSST